MSSIPRVGIIGAGGFGNVHLRELAALDREGLITLVSAADPALNSHAQIREKVQTHGLATYVDAEQMLRKEKLDAVTIASPPATHRDLLRLSLNRGARVFLEKPVVPLWNELEQILSWEDQHEVAVDYHMASLPTIESMLALVRENKLGCLNTATVYGGWPRDIGYYARNHWAGRFWDNGNPVFDGPATNAMAHLLHLSTMLCAGPGKACALPNHLQACFLRTRSFASHDTVLIRGSFDSKVRFQIALTHGGASYIPWHLELSGTLGTATLEESQFRMTPPTGSKPEIYEGSSMHRPAFENFANWISGRISKPNVSLAATRGMTALSNLAVLSAGAVTEPQQSATPEHTAKSLDALIKTVAQHGELPTDGAISWGNWGQASYFEEVSTLTAERCALLSPRWEPPSSPSAN